jgi:hypothetical protein
MKKLVVLLSVVAMSFALQAGDGDCPKKATCDKAKAATCEKAKAGKCDKAEAEAKGSCPAAKNAQDGAKKPVVSPKASS